VIRLTRLNGHPIALNSDLIKFVENAPDTVITLTSGEKVLVRENGDEVLRLVLEFRRSVLAGLSAVQLQSHAFSPPAVNLNHHSEDPRRG